MLAYFERSAVHNCPCLGRRASAALAGGGFENAPPRFLRLRSLRLRSGQAIAALIARTPTIAVLIITPLMLVAEQCSDKSSEHGFTWIIHENRGNVSPGRGGILWPTAAAVGQPARVFEPR